MRHPRWPVIITLLAAALVPWGCAGADRADADAPPIESASLTVFCHYVVIASPDLAAAYGQRLLADASPEQLRGLLAAVDDTTRRAVHLLDETGLTANHPDLGAAWEQIQARAGDAGG
jgi:type IV pilus biogenesis protein CpaD/CtpE